MVLTRTMQPRATTGTAFLTSTSPKASLKTTRTKALDGIPHYRHTGTLTTTRPKPSQPTMQSKSHPVYCKNSTDTSDSQPRDPIDWLAFTGHWGDKQYPDNDPDQFCFLGIDALCKYTNGPTGPAFKQLQRKKVCPDSQKTCIVWDVLVQRDLDG
jgi:hypothetical protein